MKKILAVIVFVLIGVASFAQWTTNGNDIYNTNTGKVGIGTSTPSTLLNVYTTASGNAEYPIFQVERPFTGTGNVALLYAKNSASGDLYFFGLKRLASGQHEGVQSIYNAATNTWRAFAAINAATGKFEVRGGVTNYEFLNSGNILMNMNGAVGIAMGTTAIPSNTKLAVGGKVVCKEVEVTLTGLPDFVFNDNYKLRSLYEVESFVKENKHLPDVPCEAEVVANGMNVGQMNATLLQKIEELTLYMISLQKENDALKARVSQLEK